MGEGNTELDDRWAPVWALVLSALVIVPFVVVGGFGVVLWATGTPEEDQGTPFDGLGPLLGCVLAWWSAFHVLPWLVFLVRGKKLWFIFGVISLVLAALMVLGIWSLLYGQFLLA